MRVTSYRGIARCAGKRLLLCQTGFAYGLNKAVQCNLVPKPAKADKETDSRSLPQIRLRMGHDYHGHKGLGRNRGDRRNRSSSRSRSRSRGRGKRARSLSRSSSRSPARKVGGLGRDVGGHSRSRSRSRSHEGEGLREKEKRGRRAEQGGEAGREKESRFSSVPPAPLAAPKASAFVMDEAVARAVAALKASRSIVASPHLLQVIDCLFMHLSCTFPMYLCACSLKRYHCLSPRQGGKLFNTLKSFI